MKSEIADLRFEEPPPLEEWLKGRTILTVAQDGRGQFRTIAEAVKALKPGQVVEILDQGPYRENLWIVDPPIDTGILSRGSALVQPDEWRTRPDGATIPVSHWIRTIGSFRVVGLVILHPLRPSRPDQTNTQLIGLETTNGFLMEDCTIVDSPQKADGEARVAHAIVLVPLDGNATTLRRCTVNGSLIVFGAGGDSTCLVRDNWFRSNPSGSGASLICLDRRSTGAILLQRNGLDGYGGCYFESGKDSR